MSSYSNSSYVTFTVTEDHIKLLKRMYVSWDDCEYGAPSIDPKRPYGNSDVVGDIVEILEWPMSEQMASGEDELPEEYEDRADRIHQEMKTVLQILVRNAGVEPGVYKLTRDYSVDWERV